MSQLLGLSVSHDDYLHPHLPPGAGGRTEGSGSPCQGVCCRRKYGNEPGLCFCLEMGETVVLKLRVLPSAEAAGPGSTFAEPLSPKLLSDV